LLAARGVKSTMDVLQYYFDVDRTAAIFDVGFGYALVDELLEKKRLPEAVAFNRLFLSIHRNILRISLDEGELHLRHRATDEARPHFKKALILDPSDAGAALNLKAIRKSRKRRSEA
jgi:hypothetical protein